jgi:hypothetical protein
VKVFLAARWYLLEKRLSYHTASLCSKSSLLGGYIPSRTSGYFKVGCNGFNVTVHVVICSGTPCYCCLFTSHYIVFTVYVAGQLCQFLCFRSSSVYWSSSVSPREMLNGIYKI